MPLISGGNTLVTPNRHWKKNFSEALVELAKFVLFAVAGLWQCESSYGLFPLREFFRFYFSVGYRSDYFCRWFSIGGDYVANCASLPSNSGSIPFLQSLVSTACSRL